MSSKDSWKQMKAILALTILAAVAAFAVVSVYEVSPLELTDIDASQSTAPDDLIDWPDIPSKKYNGSVQVADVPEQPYYRVTANEGGKDAGTYDVTLTLKGKDEGFAIAWYDKSGGAKTRNCFEIEKATLPDIPSITLELCTIYYYFGFSTGINSETVTLKYTITATAMGTYSCGNGFTVEIEGSSNYKIGNVGDVTLGDYTVPIPRCSTYDGNPHELVNSLAVPASGTYTYSVSGGSPSTSIPTAINSGSYKIDWTYVDGTINDSGSITAEILQAQPVYTAPTAKTLTYSGSAQELVNAGSSSVGTFTYCLTESGTYDSTIPSATNANNYTVYWKLEHPNYESKSGSVPVTIAKADPSFTAPSAKTLTYNGSDQELVNAGTSSVGSFTYSLYKSSSYNSKIPAKKNAGTYTVYWKLSVTDTNYNSKSGEVSVTIGKLVLMVNSHSVSYNGTTSFTVSGNEKDENHKLVAVTLTYTTDSANPGFYGWNVPGGNGFTVTYDTGDSCQNYKIDSVGALTVVKATITVTGDGTVAVSKPYDGTTGAGSLTGTLDFTGKVENEDVTVTATPGAYADANAGENKTVTLTLALSGTYSGNYTLSEESRTFTKAQITKADPTYTPPTPASDWTYDGSERDLYTKGTATNGTMKYKIDSNDYADAMYKGKNAGSYTVYWKVFGKNSNYNDSAESSFTVTVSKIVISEPTISPLTYNGNVQTPKIAGADLTLGNGKHVGSYTAKYMPSDTINSEWWDGTNKQKSFNYSIVAKQLTLSVEGDKTKVYDGKAEYPSEKYTVDGIVSMDSEVTVSAAYNDANASDSKTITFTVNGDTYGDYIAPPQLTGAKITKADPTYVVTPKTGLVYNGYHQDLVCVTGSGGIMKFNVEGAIDSKAMAIWAGTYEVSWESYSDSNYNAGSGGPFDVTISKADPTYTEPSAKTLTYNGSEQELITGGSSYHGTFTYCLTKEGTFSASIPKGTDADSYTVYWKLTGDPNHNDKSDSVTVAISKAPISSVAIKDKTYFSYTASAVVPNFLQLVVNPSGVASSDVEITATNNIEVGTATVTVAAKTTSTNYTGSASCDFTIGKACIDLIKIKSGVTFTYTGSAIVPTFDQLKVEPSVVTADDVIIEASNNVNVGWATFTVAAKSTSPHVSGYDMNYFEILKADPTYTAPTAKILTYNGSAQTLLNAGKTSHGTFSYCLTEEGEYTATIPQCTNSGSYTVYWKLTGDSNHNDKNGEVDVEIEKLSITFISVKADEKFYYTGGPIIPSFNQLDIDADGITADDVKITATDNVNVGDTSLVTVTAKDTSNYTGSESDYFHILPVDPTYTGPKANTLTYNGSDQELITAGSSDHGTFAYCLTIDGEYDWNIPSPTDAGSYTVYWKLNGDSNHNDKSGSVPVTISKATINSSNVGSYLTVAFADGKAAFYNGTAREASVSIKSPMALNGGTISVSYPEGADRVNVGSFDVNFTLTGDSNFNDVSPAIKAGSLTITASELMLEPRSVSYNGTTSFVVEDVVEPEIGGSGPVALTLTYTTTSADLGVYGHGMSEDGFTVTYDTGDSRQNYIIIHAALLTVVQATIEVTGDGTVAVSKVYDGTTSAGNLTGTLEFTGRVGDEDVTVTATPGAYADADVGDNKTVTLTLELSGTAKDNYALSEASYTFAKAQITKKIMPEDPYKIEPSTKKLTYNGSSQALLDAGSSDYGTVVYSLTSGSDFSSTIPQKTDADTYTVYYKIISDDYEDSPEKSLSVKINEKKLKITKEGSKTKVYDRTRTYSSSEYEFSGVESVDEGKVSLTAEFDVESALQATVIFFEVVGERSGNYEAPSGLRDAKITPAPSTITSVPVASAITYGQALSSSTLTGGTATGLGVAQEGSFYWTNGTIKPDASPSGSSFSVSFYPIDMNFSSSTAEVTVTVNQKTITVTDAGNKTKFYDGTDVYPASNYSVSGIEEADEGKVTVSGRYDGGQTDVTDMGGKIIFNAEGERGSNYDCSPGIILQASIIPLEPTITVSPTASDITYGQALSSSTLTGGTASATLATEDVTVDGTFEWSDSSVKPTVSQSGNSFSVTFHPDSSNYGDTTVVVPVTVNKKALTVTGIVVSDKTYDGNTTASFTSTGSLSGAESGDTVSLSSAAKTATFENKNVGTGKPIALSGYALDGTDAGNYSLTQPTGVTASITALQLTVTDNGNKTKIYDGDKDYTTFSLSNVVDDDEVTVAGNFNDASVGTGKTISFTITGGDDAGNYSAPASLTGASITKRTLTPSITHFGTATRAFDGTTSVPGTTMMSLAGAVEGQTPLASATFRTFAGVVGTQPVCAYDIELIGQWGDNYVLSSDYVKTEEGIITITAAVVTPSVTHDGTATRAYDGTTSVPGTPAISLSGVVSGFEPTVSATFALDSADVGTRDIVATGITLSGTWSENYTLSATTAALDDSITVTQKELTITGIVVSDKTYDGDASATITAYGTLSGVIDGETVILKDQTKTASFADKNVESGKKITFIGYELDGADKGNYSLTQPTGVTASITALQLTVNDTGSKTKVYDGSAAYTTFTLSNVVGEEKVTVTAAFENKNVGTNKTISFTIAGGDDKANYTAPASITGASITKKALTVTGIAVSDKTYDGTTSATISSYGSLSGAESGDTVSLSSAAKTATFDNKNVGTGKSITLSGYALDGTDAGNYSLTAPSATASITVLQLTVNDTGSKTKVYDGSAAYTTFTLSNVVGEEKVAVTAAFGDKNVGTGKTISFTITGGADKDNYSAPASITGASITKKALTVTGIIVSNKTYDGTTSATISNYGSLSGVVEGDTVSLSSATKTATFDNKNVKIGKTVALSGYVLDGTDAGNYSLTAPSATASITPRQLTVNDTGSATKVYDGTEAYTTFTLSNIVENDKVTVTAAFDDENVGTGRTIAFGITGGVDMNNYIEPDSLTGASITAKELTVTGIVVSNKTYDGNTSATFTSSGSLSGAIDDDDVALKSGVTAAFADKTVGEDKTITLSTYEIEGDDAGNYYLTQPTGITASITAKELTVTGIVVSDKTYDGKTTASFTNTGSLSGAVVGDDVALKSGMTATFDNKNVGTGKSITLSGYALDGTDAGNYSLTQPTGVKASITAKTVTITGIVVSDKTYDGKTTASFTSTGSLSGAESGDAVSLKSGMTATFADKNVGTGKAITLSTYELQGADKGNYSLTQPTGVTASITALQLTVNDTGSKTKVYDGSAAYTTFTLSNVVGEEKVTVTAAFENKNVGTNKTISFTIAGGDDKANYTAPASITGASITKKALTVTGIAVSDKTYDGTTSATISSYGSLSGAESGDTVSLSSAAKTATFDNKNVGTGKSITLSGYALDGTDAGNYSLTTPSATASITVLQLTINDTGGATKVWDGTTEYDDFTLSNVVDDDEVTVEGNFNDASVGTGKIISFTITGGADAGNYSAPANITDASITGAVQPDQTTVLPTASAITYGQPLSASSLTGGIAKISGTEIPGTFAWTAPSYVPKISEGAAGLSVTFTPSDTTAYGSKTFTVKVTVNALKLTVTDNGNKTKEWDGTTAYNKFTLSNVVGGDKVTVAGKFNDSSVGTGKTISFTITGGADAANYTKPDDITNATITSSSMPEQPYKDEPTAKSLVYDGTQQTLANPGSSNYGTVVYSLSSGGPFDQTIPKGTDATGYKVYYKVTSPVRGDSPVKSIEVSIAKKQLSISSPGDKTKVYDGSTVYYASKYTVSGIETADKEKVTVTANYNDSSIGTNKTISFTLSGTRSGNYSAPGQLTGASIIEGIVPDGTTVLPTASSITYGQKLSASTLTGGVAKASGTEIPGSFSWTNPSYVPKISEGAAGLSVTFIPTDTSKYGSKTFTVNVTVNVLKLTVTDTGNKTKAYDGTTSYTKFTVNNRVGSDNLSVTASFDSAAVGTGKTIAFSISGSDAANYLAPDSITGASITESAKVVPKASDFSVKVDADLTYNGHSKTVTVTAASGVKGLGAISVKYSGSNVNAGTFKVLVSVTEGTDYQAVSELEVGEYTISKASPTKDMFTFSGPDSKVYDGKPKTVEVSLAKSLTGAGAVTVHYSDNVNVGTCIVSIDVTEGSNILGGKNIVIGSFDITSAPGPEPVPWYESSSILMVIIIVLAVAIILLAVMTKFGIIGGGRRRRP